MEGVKISLHEAKSIALKLSAGIAYLKNGDYAEAVQEFEELETFMKGKFVLDIDHEHNLGYD